MSPLAGNAYVELLVSKSVERLPAKGLEGPLLVAPVLIVLLLIVPLLIVLLLIVRRMEGPEPVLLRAVLLWSSLARSLPAWSVRVWRVRVVVWVPTLLPAINSRGRVDRTDVVAQDDLAGARFAPTMLAGGNIAGGNAALISPTCCRECDAAAPRGRSVLRSGCEATLPIDR